MKLKGQQLVKGILSFLHDISILRNFGILYRKKRRIRFWIKFRLGNEFSPMKRLEIYTVLTQCLRMENFSSNLNSSPC